PSPPAGPTCCHQSWTSRNSFRLDPGLHVLVDQPPRDPHPGLHGADRALFVNRSEARARRAAATLAASSTPPALVPRHIDVDLGKAALAQHTAQARQLRLQHLPGDSVLRLQGNRGLVVLDRDTDLQRSQLGRIEPDCSLLYVVAYQPQQALAHRLTEIRVA